MKFNLKKSSNLFGKNKLIVAPVLLIVAIGLVGTVYAVNSRTNNERNIGISTQTSGPVKNKKNVEDITSSNVATADAPVQSTSTAPSPSTSAVGPSQPPTAKTTAPSSKSQSNDPPPETLKITGLTVSGQSVCDSGLRRLYLGYAYINTNTYPGTINWQIEARKNNAISIVGSGSANMAMYSGSYEIKNTYDMYTQAVTGDAAIRLHVTSPSDTAPAWFTAESLAAGSPCAYQ